MIGLLLEGAAAARIRNPASRAPYIRISGSRREQESPAQFARRGDRRIAWGREIEAGSVAWRPIVSS
jgi:hypothetical protein